MSVTAAPRTWYPATGMTRTNMTAEDRIVSLESKVMEMQSSLEKYKNRFRDQKLFCKYIAEYLLHKFGFNIWLRLEMVKAAGEGDADSGDEGLLPHDMPSIFKVAVNKSSKERLSSNSPKPVVPLSVSSSPPKYSAPISGKSNISGASANNSGRTLGLSGNSPNVPSNFGKGAGNSSNNSTGHFSSVSGSPVNTSGNFAKMSSNPVSVSRSFTNVSGNSVNSSGNFANMSSNSVNSSGNFANMSSNSVNSSRNFGNLSGNPANYSGKNISGTNTGGISVPLNIAPGANGAINSVVGNRGVKSSQQNQSTVVVQGGHQSRRRPSTSVSPRDGKPAKVFAASGDNKVSSVSSTFDTCHVAQNKVESPNSVDIKVPACILNMGGGGGSVREIRVVGNVVELPEVDISGMSKETEDGDPLYDLDYGSSIPEMRDCSSYSTHPLTSQSAYVTTSDNNVIEVIHDDYNDPSIEIKYEDAFDETSIEEIPAPEVDTNEVSYQVIAPPKVNQRAAARCRRSSPFDINWLYQMKKYQSNVMPYATLIKRDEHRQWFEYLPSEKPEESRYRCRLCYKYMQTYGLPRSNWGPVESERGQLKRTESDNRNVINTHGKKKSHLEIMKRLQMEGNPEVGFIDRFDKTMKKQLLDSLEKDF